MEANVDNGTPAYLEIDEIYSGDVREIDGWMAFIPNGAAPVRRIRPGVIQGKIDGKSRSLVLSKSPRYDENVRPFWRVRLNERSKP